MASRLSVLFLPHHDGVAIWGCAYLLPAHLRYVGTSLGRVEQEGERQPRPRTDGMPRLELRNLAFAPAMDAATLGLLRLDAKEGVILDHFDGDDALKQYAQHLEQVVGGVWRVGLGTDDVPGVLAGQPVHGQIAEIGKAHV